MPPPPPSNRPHRPFTAIGLRLLAVICLSIMFVTVRLADARGVHVVESLFYRQALALPVVFAWIAMTSGMGSIRTRRIGVHATRMIIGLTGMVLNFLSYILLLPAEAVTIGFTMPIFGTILSALILRETTGIHRWSAVLIGFLGVIVMVRPDAGHFPAIGVAVALAAAFVTACVSLVLRELGRTESAGVIVFWFTLLSLPPLGVAMLFHGQAHDAMTWGLLLLIGVTGGIAQICMTAALRWAPVSVVLPMDYSSIVWTTLLGWAIWGNWPIATTWIGAALIVGSGLYIAWREHVHARRTPSA
ncbi:MULTISPECIES: DMT family transporter [Sphingobium]|uniref:Permease n=1 Tax=Sphingobium fuliginis (strain ATCC 27551) TaxID=336203 RepID=A0ABQ1ERC2_SPHSA|nr:MULTISPECIES: DMT family transporter [Sphingobium]AJR24779.1 permease [Sphingobium sp. YBL2]RYL99314.1 DMT family transporter [Sphingobium fuliginis]WDA36869.1 DMT family transporter [Sphingobium sp. YC-XJ3]GFZ83917.1 permease [Sphingobium fuliginis]